MPFVKGHKSWNKGKKYTIPYNITLRQQKYKSNRLIGMTKYDAAIAAGYSPSTAASTGKKLAMEAEVRSTIVDEFNRAGLTDMVLAKAVLEHALGAKKIQNARVIVRKDENGKLVVDDNGDDFIEVPDNQVRLKALELAAKLKKHLSPVEVQNVDNSRHATLTLIVAPPMERNGTYQPARSQDLPDSGTVFSVAPTNGSH